MTQNTKRAGRQKGSIREENEGRILLAAEKVFAELGFKGATTGRIAEEAGVPKSNVHYYFRTKEAIYKVVMEDLCTTWLSAARDFDDSHDPASALRDDINAKMDLALQRPYGSRVWVNEMTAGAPVIKDYLHDTVKPWMDAHVAVVNRWIASGKMCAVEPQNFIYMIWASTQHYADFEIQINVMNGGNPLSEEQFEVAKQNVADILLRGVGLLV